MNFWYAVPTLHTIKVLLVLLIFFLRFETLFKKRITADLVIRIKYYRTNTTEFSISCVTLIYHISKINGL